jgi:hypothetical protein
MSSSEDIVTAITPLLPEDWQIVPFSDEPNVLNEPLVMVAMTNINPGAIVGTYDLEHHVYVLIPLQEDEAANTAEVNDAVLITLDALLRMRAVTQGTATRGTYQGGNPGWDITINIQASVTDEEVG